MNKLISKIKNIISNSPEVAKAVDATVKAAKVVAQDIVAQDIVVEVQKTPAKKAAVKKVK